MTGRARLVGTGLPAGAISTTRSMELASGWTLLDTEPGAAGTPEQLDDGAQWTGARVPGTVAASIGPDHPDRHMDYDARDWWYRVTVAAPEDVGPDDRVRLRFDGLATLAEVWWNGQRLLESSDMFLTHEVDVTDLVQPENRLAIVFRSLGAALAERRARPRWKTRLIDAQQLRWFRTTLLGRIPGWTPAIAPVGPWRSIHLESVTTVDVASLRVRARLENGTGLVDVHCALERIAPDTEVTAASLEVAGRSERLTVAEADGTWSVQGVARVPDPELWWPRTHGEPHLYACTLHLETSAGAVVVDCGEVGFRTITLDRDGGRIRFVVNGVEVFCRGACWTSNDIVSLVGPEDRMRETLRLLADANANMLRVGGTMVYETDAFYAECDRLGLMVWQDFMFANMDYPFTDESFAQLARDEAEQQLVRLARHPAVVAYCGGSEVEQQAAMFGAPREVWTNDFFASDLPRLVLDIAGETTYWPSTPTGGALPFHVGEGLAHYFGVGAYRRPLDDVRLARVRFSPECLGFSNLPEDDNLRRLDADGGAVRPQHPSWKAGIPRDGGTAWDFEDVRDHYLASLRGVDPARQRAEDPDGYVRASRTITGRVMAHVFDEWRSAESECGGGLVWFLKDLRPGAGWGIIDSDNVPKAVYHFLKRAWQPRRIALLDRGLDGLAIDVHNESAVELAGTLGLTVLNRDGVALAEAARTVRVPPRRSLRMVAEELLDRFADPTYSYRFGPRAHFAVVARLDIDGAGGGSTVGSTVLRDVFWPSLADDLPPVDLSASMESSGVRVTSPALARDVRIESRRGRPTENYFDLVAPDTIDVAIESVEPQDDRVFVDAENASATLRLTPGN